ncbi:helix-turn-helix protein [Aquimarina sp. MAR_2010_214]|uniref:helix-turn-helix domain-containing protein n=1 Tax=Aquimarina sp. MAR_2010_214 TaxID=1250026 RepID=UPI000C71289D|nr:helix-turn-helix transcriptional regulator [Aquimarina sp. MAR_2010_214]PKV49587.1 helix-turn-helix protein [Aquimarina sp. MAR_2010_214]
MTEENTFLYSIGRNIAKLRRKKGLSQLDVCAEIKMEKPNLSSIENGRQNVTSLTLLKIAKAIGVEVKEFFEI